MPRLTAAEEFLIEQIRKGDADAWRQLVGRYQGRLIAFASHDLPSSTDAEDTVQETFVSLLQSLPGFRADSSLETYLFVILRRRIADFFRRCGHRTVQALPEGSMEESVVGHAGDHLRSSEMTASWYVRRDESRDQQFRSLALAVDHLVSSLRDELKFDDLLLFELLFSLQRRNKEIASLLEVDEKWIAVRKHRYAKLLSRLVSEQCDEGDPTALSTDLDSGLTQIWSELRPTCPKRSTIGKYLLGTLDDAWTGYIDRHLELVQCRFCAANLQDLENEASRSDLPDSTSRIMRSTIGFFRPS